MATGTTGLHDRGPVNVGVTLLRSLALTMTTGTTDLPDRGPVRVDQVPVNVV